MTPSSFAGVVTAISTVIIAVGGLITALTVFVPIVRRSKSTEKKVDQVHTLVNQRFTDMERRVEDGNRYIRALVNALDKAGVDVPDDQSKQAEAEPEPA